MGSREGPWEWLCGWCRSLCSCSQCKCSFRCFDCSCCTCKCNCVPLLCPSAEDRLQVEEVSAADYIDEERTVKAKPREDTAMKAALRSFAGFSTGIIITTLYALIVLYVKNYNLWFCLTTTLTIGFFLTLGMAFSLRVRITVLLMLPQIFSGEAKTIILFIAFALVMQGPGANIMENTQRSSQSLACGTQLALNETKEMLLKVTKPLMSALNALKDIGQNLRPVTEHAFKFFRKMFDGIKHAGKVLRSAWAFIANIGDICSEELERPYIKCNKLFDEAKDKCFRVMSFLGFLCYILDAFRPLCGLARIIVILCVIPDYVQHYVRKQIKNPLQSIVRNFKDQFDFNITVIRDYNEDYSAHRSFYEVAAGIVKELKEDAQIYMEMLHMFSYSMIFVCIFTYIQALRYRRNYLTDINHDNIYITRAFIELDVMRAKQNRNSLLPLSSGEAYGFIRPGSLSLTRQEKKGYVFDIINVFRSFLVAIFVVAVDYVFFWTLDIVAHLMRGDVITRAPLILSLLVNGTGHADEIYTSVVSAFEAIQKSNITVHTRKCQVRPSEPDFSGYLLIAFLHGFAFSIAIFGIYLKRLRRYICAYYYPTREQTRICFLYNQLLTKRVYVERALLQSIRVNDADKGHHNILLILAAKCPWLFGWLAKFMDSKEEYCMACAQVCTGKNREGYHACSTFGCKGIYCQGCSRILKETCTLCMAPLVCDDSEGEEMYSSDDEKVVLWMEAMKTIKKEEKPKRKQMRKVIKSRLKETIKRRGKNKELIQKYKESTVSSDSGESSGLSDVDTGGDSGESDFGYQTSKDNEDFYSPKWESPTESRLRKADPIRPAAAQDVTTGDSRRGGKETDVEKGLGY